MTGKESRQVARKALHMHALLCRGMLYRTHRLHMHALPCRSMLTTGLTARRACWFQLMSTPISARYG
jgi:hypothetical protein